MNINLPVRHIKVFGWRIYFSRGRMKRCTTSTIRISRRRRNKTKNMGKKKERRYKQLGGCCQMCGRHHDISQMEMHHILPYSNFPELANKSANMMLLCRQCHFFIHNDPTLNMMLMSRFAAQIGIDLSKRYHHIVTNLWNAAQLAQQKKMEIENAAIAIKGDA